LETLALGDWMARRRSKFKFVLGCILVVAQCCFLMGCRVLKAPPEVAFLGDSITQGWKYPAANYGIFGNTTSQMLTRFDAQISGRGFRQIVILGGTNDVLQKVDPEVTLRNLEQIGVRAARQGTTPVLCEIPPIFHSFDPADRLDYSQRVRGLNLRIAQLAAAHGWKLIDYYDPMLGHPDYSSDGVHMKRRGYAVMEWAFLREAPAA